MLDKLRKEMRNRTALAISGAFALIIALTWNEAIKSVVNSLVRRMGLPETFFWHNIIVAVIITFICVIGIMAASRYSVKE